VPPKVPSIVNASEAPVDDNAEQAASEAEEVEAVDSVSDFDVLIGIAPQSSSDFLDEARASVSTAHSASSNQHASSLFFNWLPIFGSVAPVLIAVYLHSLGLSLSESLLALSAAILAAFVTTTTGAIAGKRSGLQTFIVSRATFGVYGARIPAAVFAILKLVAASLMVLLLVIASNKAQDGWSVEGVTATRWQVGPISVALWQIIIGVSVIVVTAISFVKLSFVKFLNLLLH
jgi:purine-cytosine permease-like protein